MAISITNHTWLQKYSSQKIHHQKHNQQAITTQSQWSNALGHNKGRHFTQQWNGTCSSINKCS